MESLVCKCVNMCIVGDAMCVVVGIGYWDWWPWMFGYSVQFI
jgi:hypothetical protein